MPKQGGVICKMRTGKPTICGRMVYGLHIVRTEADLAGVQWNMGTLAWFEMMLEPQM